MASQFGEEIDSILKKDGREWTNAEKDKINALMKDGKRLELKTLREQLRG